MIEKHLGESIDIHGGGNDLKFPHHENELAQSSCVHGGAPLSRFWVHNGFVQIDTEKMSKSIGNVLLVQDMLQHHPGEAIRFALIKARYREPLNWDAELIDQAKSQLDRLYGALERVADCEIGTSPPAAADFYTAMDDDLNTAKAIASLMESVTRANTAASAAEKARAKSELVGGGLELGILQQSPERWFGGDPENAADIARINDLIAARTDARTARDYSRADAIRDELDALGVQIQDGPEGTTWRR
jgi:cysteinyl-tRNA synthetase